MPVSAQSYRSLLDCENIYTQQFVNKIALDLSEGPVLVWVHSHHFTIKVTTRIMEGMKGNKVPFPSGAFPEVL